MFFYIEELETTVHRIEWMIEGMIEGMIEWMIEINSRSSLPKYISKLTNFSTCNWWTIAWRSRGPLETRDRSTLAWTFRARTKPQDACTSWWHKSSSFRRKTEHLTRGQRHLLAVDGVRTRSCWEKKRRESLDIFCSSSTLSLSDVKRD